MVSNKKDSCPFSINSYESIIDIINKFKGISILAHWSSSNVCLVTIHTYYNLTAGNENNWFNV